MILFIDDEPHYIRSYIQAFELSGFEVVVAPTVDHAWETLSSKTDEVDAVILDIMMPPGRLFDLESTKDGLRSGTVFLERLCVLDERIPVIILTNADKTQLGEIAHRNCLVYEKKEISPWGLVDRMSDVKRRAKLDD